jgi:hypothetical protein
VLENKEVSAFTAKITFRVEQAIFLKKATTMENVCHKLLALSPRNLRLLGTTEFWHPERLITVEWRKACVTAM